MKDTDDLLDELEVKVRETTLSDNVQDLQKEVLRLRKILESYSIEDEMHITNIEYICQKGIDNLKVIAGRGCLTQDEAKTLDLLHKNLRQARGQLEKKDLPGKTATEAELLKIVKGTKK